MKAWWILRRYTNKGVTSILSLGGEGLWSAFVLQYWILSCEVWWQGMLGYTCPRRQFNSPFWYQNEDDRRDGSRNWVDNANNAALPGGRVFSYYFCASLLHFSCASIFYTTSLISLFSCNECFNCLANCVILSAGGVTPHIYHSLLSSTQEKQEESRGLENNFSIPRPL